MSELTIQDFDQTKGLHKWETGEVITAEDLNQNDAAIFLIFDELPQTIHHLVTQELENANQATIPSYSILIEGESSGPIP